MQHNTGLPVIGKLEQVQVVDIDIYQLAARDKRKKS